MEKSFTCKHVIQDNSTVKEHISQNLESKNQFPEINFTNYLNVFSNFSKQDMSMFDKVKNTKNS